MYAAQLGRFITRDPLPQAGAPDVLYDNNWFGEWLTTMTNLYGYASSTPTTITDPFGLQPLSPDGEGHEALNGTFPEPPPLIPFTPGAGRGWPVYRERYQKFVKWYRSESAQGLGWTAALPACPCDISCDDGSVKSPDPNVWQEPTKMLWGFHVGAASCMRSKPKGDSAQQCCYDSKGKLITHGSGTGSADRVSTDVKNFGEGGHQERDVAPANWAWLLDGAQFGKFSELYLVVRPSNNANKCAQNP